MAGPPQPTVTTHDDFGTVNVVETPTSPSAAFTLSRFEFQAGTKGNEGTKILMVEWDAAAALSAGEKEDGKEENKQAENEKDEPQRAAAAADPNDWEVKWDGKEVLTSVQPIRDADTPAPTCRLYFLLPPGAPIPTLVTVSHRRRGDVADAAAAAVPDLHAKPLPAIFPDGLAGLDKGERGVLHTIWARARVGQLGAEIAAEMKSNGESVGLEMALQERQWIIDHFGLGLTAGDLGDADGTGAALRPLAPQGAGSPTSPRSPLGGRLGEKLKGLKLATSPAELAAAKEASQTMAKKFTAVAPDSAPAGFQPMSMATGGNAGSMASLSAVMQGGGPGVADRGNDAEDLFALPMSPRSPEMAMSPFSMLKS